LTAVLVGCGGVPQEPGLAPLSGHVTLDGGPWPKPGEIVFVPTKAGKDANASTVSYVATFGTDGAFTVAHPGANGAKPGTYWVSVQCKEGESKMPLPGEKVEEKNYVPQQYRNPETSGLKFTVEEGTSNVANFDIKSSK
jgi:hypothetical protein